MAGSPDPDPDDLDAVARIVDGSSWAERLRAEIRALPEVWFGIPDDEWCKGGDA